MHKNIDYYNKNAKQFYDETVNADMSFWRNRFEHYLPAGGSVLDAGCGSGRDSLVFMQHGYDVTACDASKELCDLASSYIGKQVECIRFEDLSYSDQFDGIWACASLLHVDIDSLDNVMRRIRNALKKCGILYVSFKYGKGNVVRGEREFTDMDETTVKELMINNGFEILECDISTDIRPERENEKWINAISRKKS